MRYVAQRLSLVLRELEKLREEGVGWDELLSLEAERRVLELLYGLKGVGDP
jgi:hypothetical protein